jgi:hypothetical protein
MRPAVRLLAVVLLLCLAGTAPAQDFQKIHFTADGTATGTPLAPGFTMNSCWGAVGYHYNGNVYVAISNHTENTGNVALFRYHTQTGTMHFINDIRSISTAAGNWLTGDTHYKIHSQLPLHADRKIYMTTQEDGNPLFLGAKMYVLDSLSNVTDYTQTAPAYLDSGMNTRSGSPGYLTAKHGIICLGVNPRVPDLVYAVTCPNGWLLRFTPSTGAIKKVAKTTTYFSDYITRYLGVDNQGNAYWAQRTAANTKQMYKYRRADSTTYAIGSTFTETSSYAYWGGFAAQVATASNDTLYGRTFENRTIRVVYATETVEDLGTSGLPVLSYADHNLAISRDNNHLYSLKMAWTNNGTTPGVRLYDYTISAGTFVRGDFIPLYENYDLTKGMHIADTYGNFYVVGWKGSGGTGFDNIALLKVNPGFGLVGPNPPLSVWGLSDDIAVRDRQPRPAAALTDVQAGPSPFRQWVTFGFRLSAAGPASVAIYDVRGRLMTSLQTGQRPAGYQMVAWDGKDSYRQSVSNGMYTYEISAHGQTTRGMVMKMK